MEQKPPTEAIANANRELLTTLPFDDTRDFDDAERGFIAALEPGVVHARGRPRRVGQRQLRLPDRRRSDDGQPEPVAPVAAGRAARPVRGRRRHLPGARPRPVEHHLRRGRHRRDRDRPAHLRPRRPRRRSACTASIAATGRSSPSSTPTATSTTSAACSASPPPGGRRRRHVADHRPGGVHRARGHRERLRRHRDGPSRRLHVRRGRSPAARRARSEPASARRTSTGEVGLIVPTDSRSPRRARRSTIDGVEIEFQMAPGTEAPAEMHFYFPKYRALCMAENATHTLHNLLTLRGALVRDPHVWANYLDRGHRARSATRTDVALRLPPLADVGHRRTSSSSSPSSATCTPTCTTRPCGCSTRATTGAEIAEKHRAAAGARRRRGTRTATTARSATT